MGWVALGIALLVLIVVAAIAYLSVVLVWSDNKTNGLGYYGLSPEGRDRFRASLRRHAVLLKPLLLGLSRLGSAGLERASFTVGGVSGPRGTCTEDSFEAAMSYEPRPDDVFVVTQMKCGTTWMQHLVYEVLCRGSGDLVATGKALYAISPWLESTKSVPVTEAPAVGEGPSARIVKTHLPAGVCPYAEHARYLYVVRHPGSCFASCVDFLRQNMGPFQPDLDAMEAWFCSPDAMWWGTWPDHVAGWWHRARSSDNVLWVSFEEMTVDLGRIARRVADFLGVESLRDEDLNEIVRKCGFEYMRRHKRSFEMHPPHLLAVDAELFRRGSSERYQDLPAAVNERIVRWCAARVDGSGIPMKESYPIPDPR